MSMRLVCRLTFAAVALLALTTLNAENKEKAVSKDASATDASADPSANQAPDQASSNEAKFSVTPYGRIELDLTYSSRGTNPLDPRQFNGYSTAAGPESTSSATFNPRFSVIGLVSNYQKGDQSIEGRVEVDFYSTDGANLFTPRLRLAYVAWSRQDTKVTAGMDWLPVAQLLPDIMDFSIMGYGGDLWQRIPQVTLRQKFGKHWEALGTAYRFERGFTLQPQPGVSDPFTDPVKMPYIGARLAYQKWGIGGGGLLAVSTAYRQFTQTTGPAIKSDLISAEFAVPVTKRLKVLGKWAHGQGLGDEYFRFGQAYNATLGNAPIRTSTGFGELSYAPASRWVFAAGYGLDNPKGDDLRGISNNDLNYRRNQREFVNGTYTLLENLKLSLELNYLQTAWTGGAHDNAYQPMASIFYTF